MNTAMMIMIGMFGGLAAAGLIQLFASIPFKMMER